MPDPTEIGPTEEEFREDLRTLTATQLRKKYDKEQNSHADMIRREKEGMREVHPSWRTFRNFLADMGPRRIEGGSLDRIDNSNPLYGPGLCRWATKEEQTRNRANTRWVIYHGERMPAAEFFERIGIPYTTGYSALDRGESPETIALRASAAFGAGAYVPSWADTDVKRDAFEREFFAWAKQVKIPARQRLVSRQAYAAIWAARAFDYASKRLDKVGWGEVAPGEEPDFDTAHRQLLLVYRNALQWAQEAAQCLIDTGEPFGARLYPLDAHELIQKGQFDPWFRTKNNPKSDRLHGASRTVAADEADEYEAGDYNEP